MYRWFVSKRKIVLIFLAVGCQFLIFCEYCYSSELTTRQADDLKLASCHTLLEATRDTDGDVYKIKISHEINGIKFQHTIAVTNHGEKGVPEGMLEGLSGKKVADIGAGSGPTDSGKGHGLVEYLRGLGIEAYGIDLILTEEQKKLPYFIVANAIDTKLPSASYDFVLSSFSVFYYYAHYEDLPLLKIAFSEAIRLLKVGGELRISPLFINNKIYEAALGLRTDVELINSQNEGFLRFKKLR